MTIAHYSFRGNAAGIAPEICCATLFPWGNCWLIAFRFPIIRPAKNGKDFSRLELPPKSCDLSSLSEKRDSEET